MMIRQKSLFSHSVPALLLSSCVVVMGCSSDKDPVATAVSGVTAPAAANPAAQAPSSHPFADALAGNWLAPCDNSSSGSSKQQQISFNGLSAVLTVRDYTDLDCRTPATPAEQALTFALVIPGGTTSTSLGEATNVDLTPKSMTFDGQPASAEQMAQMPADTSYDIMLIADAKLYAGQRTEERDGSTAEKRTQTLETGAEYVFVRQ